MRSGNHPFEAEPGMGRVDKAIHLVGNYSARDELTDRGLGSQPSVAESLCKGDVFSPPRPQFGSVLDQRIGHLDLPAAEPLYAGRSLDVNEGLGHGQRRALGRVHDRTSSSVPPTLSVESAAAVEGVSSVGGIRRERDAVQAHDGSHDVAVSDTVQDAFDLAGPEICVQEVDRLSTLKSRRWRGEPVGSGLVG